MPTQSEIPAAATPAEIEQLDSLTLQDFAEELQNLKFEHQGERPTAAEIDADVARFLQAIR
jgi:hypothetical protein